MTGSHWTDGREHCGFTRHGIAALGAFERMGFKINGARETPEERRLFAIVGCPCGGATSCISVRYGKQIRDTSSEVERLMREHIDLDIREGRLPEGFGGRGAR